MREMAVGSVLSCLLFAVGAILVAQPVLAQTQTVKLTTGASSASSLAPNAVAGCPNNGGLLDSISVPVNKSVALRVQIGAPVNYDASFQLRARNPAFVAAGDKVQGFLPVVTVPAGQVVSNPFNIFGINVGATTLDILPLSPGFSASGFPTGAWDVNKSGGTSKFVDANPPSATCRVANSAAISTSASVLASCGTTVKGAAADGVTQLLMRTLSGLPGTACFEVTSTSSLEQGTVATPLAATQAVSGLNYAFSLFKTPTSYGDTSSSRDVRVTFTFTPNIGNANTTTLSADLTVVRPPVVLMHGLWSSPSAWDDAFVRNDATHTTVKGDYKNNNASNFSTNVPTVKLAIDNALKQFRAGQRAATQVDVVGHSMGGILSRLYANGSGNVRFDNYSQGDIRRLVTLDTPHWGSTLANLLVSLHVVAPRRVDFIGGIIGSVTQGAVCDLAENSPALAGVGATAVPGSTITATGGTFPAYRTAIENGLTARVCNSWSLGLPPTCNSYSYLFPQNRVNGFRFQQANDQIVGQTDQMGGLGGWNFPTLEHTNVNTTPAVATRAFTLFDGPASGLAGTSYPAAASTGLGNPAAPPRGVTGLGAALDQADYAAQCGAGGPMNSPAARSPVRRQLAAPAATVSPGVVITSPAPQQRFAPGDTVDVLVFVDGALGATDVVVGMPPALLAGTTRLDISNYRAVQTIPADYAGPLTITPIAVDGQDREIEGAPVTILVAPNTPPGSVAFAQKYYHLEPGAPVQQLSLTGTFSASGPKVDLSSAVSGTQYMSSNPAVAAVSANGAVSIVSSGTAVISGANGPASDQAVFVIENAASQPAPENVSAAFSVQRGGFRLDRNTGFYVQSVVVTNASAAPVPASAYLVLTGLPAGVSLVNKTGDTGIAQAGSPFVTLPLSADGRTLAPGQASTLTLQFLNPNRVNINYTSSVFRSSTAP